MGWQRRGLLMLALAASLGATLLSGGRVAQDPTSRPFIDRSAAEITAATDRMLARAATPLRLTALIDARLAQTPRNWVALDALAGLAGERGIPLPDAYAPARAADHGLLRTTRACATCAYDPAACTLSNMLVCQVPVALTPLSDVTGILRAATASATGRRVDRIDLTLSILGLGATAALLASGGTSAAVKGGTSTVKIARSMQRLSPRLAAMAEDAALRGVDWAALPAARSAGDLRRLIRAEALAPLAATLTEISRLRAATGIPETLHLLPLIDNATDAARFARSAQALGPRLVARAEVLGKARLLRATIRVSDTALSLFASLTALVTSLVGLFAGLAQSATLHLLRRPG